MIYDGIVVSDHVIIISCHDDASCLLEACVKLSEIFPEKRFELERLYMYVRRQLQQQEKFERIARELVDKLRDILHRAVVLRYSPF